MRRRRVQSDRLHRARALGRPCSVFDYISVAGSASYLSSSWSVSSITAISSSSIWPAAFRFGADLPSIRPYVEQSMAGLLYDSTSPMHLPQACSECSPTRWPEAYGEMGVGRCKRSGTGKMEARLFEVTMNWMLRSTTSYGSAEADTQRAFTLTMGGHGFEAQVLSDSISVSMIAWRENTAACSTLDLDGPVGDSLTRYGIHDAGGALRGGFCLFGRKVGADGADESSGHAIYRPFFESRAQHPVARLEERRDVLTAIADLLDHLHPAVVSVALAQWLPTACFFWRNTGFLSTHICSTRQDGGSHSCGHVRSPTPERQSTDGLLLKLTDDKLKPSPLSRRLRRSTGKGREARVLGEDSLPMRIRNSYALWCDQADPDCRAFVVSRRQKRYYLLGVSLRGQTQRAVPWLCSSPSTRQGAWSEAFDFEALASRQSRRYFRGFGEADAVFTSEQGVLPLEMALSIQEELF